MPTPPDRGPKEEGYQSLSQRFRCIGFMERVPYRKKKKKKKNSEGGEEGRMAGEGREQGKAAVSGRVQPCPHP